MLKFNKYIIPHKFTYKHDNNIFIVLISSIVYKFIYYINNIFIRIYKILKNLRIKTGNIVYIFLYIYIQKDYLEFNV